MGRYSFFISNSFLSGYSVSSASELDNDLSGRSEQSLAIGGDISSNDQDSLSSDNVGVKSTENQNSEDNSQSREEIRNEIELKAPEDFDEQGNLIDDSFIKLPIPESITKNENSPEANEDRANNGWRFGIDPLMSRAINWASFPGTVRSGPNNGYYITGYFKAWNIAGTTQASMIANNIDMITMQARKSFAALEWNETQLGAEINRAHTRLDNLDGKVNTNTRGLQSQIDGLNRWINQFKVDYANLNGKVDSHKNGLQSQIDGLNRWINGQKTFNANIDNKITTNTKGLQSQLDGINTWINDQKTFNANVDNKITTNTKGLQSQLDGLNKWINGQKSYNSNNDNRIDKIEKALADLRDFSWSDVGIIGALGLVKDSIDSFKTAFTDLFLVDELVGLTAHEGKFTRMIKSQFIALRNDLANLFFSYFGADVKDGTVNPRGAFSKLLDDLIYKVRYTTIQEFSELKEFLEAQSTIFLESLNLVNDSLLAMRKNQISISEWLELIYEKPVGNVIAPPFDFSRLEQILKSLSFGEITNEAGTNFWDFMKGLIDNLGEILGKALDGLVDIASKILDFLDGLIDKLLALIIPENWDFLDKGFDDISKEFNLKFKLFLDLGGTIKDIFTPNKKDFFSAVSWSYLGVTFDGQEAKPIMDQFVPRFRTLAQVSIWLMVAWWVYRKVTGSGDLINDN